MGSTSRSALQHNQHYTAWRVTATKNQSRNSDSILLAEIIAILKHQPGVHEKESKSPFLFNRSGKKKRTSVFALILCLCALQLSNMPLSLEGDLATHNLASVCHLVIMDAASPAPKQISEITVNSVGIFPVDFPVSFNYSYVCVFTGKSYILTIWYCHILYNGLKW